jgi:peptide-methionine (S)-S-oxide reductase
MLTPRFNRSDRFVFTLLILSLLGASCGAIPNGVVNSNTTVAKEIKFVEPMIDLPANQLPGVQTIVLAGGCFWGMEAVFAQLKGVANVVSGFSGGTAADAHYDLVSKGRTDHAEAIKITYNPNQISLGQLLKVYFFIAHDPTQVNRQEPDQGRQYRSAIFFATADQQRVARAYLDQLNQSHVFPQLIATQVVVLTKFYPAEDYHQDFIDHNPTYPYVVVNDLPKIDRLKRQFPNLVKKS